MASQFYYVYILFNRKTGRYYIGYTSKLRKRVKKHRSGLVLPTKSDLNYKLVWYCGFKTRNDAVKFEKYLKSGSG